MDADSRRCGRSLRLRPLFFEVGVGDELFDLGDSFGVFLGVELGGCAGGVIGGGDHSATLEEGDGFDVGVFAYEAEVVGQGWAVLGLVLEAFQKIAAVLEIL